MEIKCPACEAKAFPIHSGAILYQCSNTEECGLQFDPDDAIGTDFTE